MFSAVSRGAQVTRIVGQGRRLLHTSTSRLSNIYKIQTIEEFTEKVSNSKTPVIVDFFATWCGPCKMLTPRIESIIQENEGKISLVKVDVDEHSDLALDHEVSSVPVLVAFNKGKEENRIIGLQDTDKLRKWVGDFVKKKAEKDRGKKEEREKNLPDEPQSDEEGASETREPTEEEIQESKKPENQLNVETVRGKKRKFTQKNAEQSKEKLKNLEKESAVTYLKRWKNEKNRWKFEKLKQIFIQNNALNEDKFDEEMWPIVLEYLEKSKGASRKFVIDTAEKVIQEVDQAIEEDSQKTALLKGSRYLRARELLQILH
uniref:Uncharacterized protein n=1 Tax=Phlebotomus papatasi TaxID=29031 RepID=A0A1B0DGC8_PHLPP